MRIAVTPAVTAMPEVSAPDTRTQVRRWARRLRRSPNALTGAAMLGVITAACLIGNGLHPWQSGDQDVSHLGAPPGVGGHLLGTDAGGFDLVALLLEGTGRSLLISVTAGCCATILGVSVGAAIALARPGVERLGRWALDLLLVMPGFLIVAVAMGSGTARHGLSSAGGSALLLAALLTLFGWMLPARVARALTLSLRERDYVRAATYLGLPTASVIRRHILPHLVSFALLTGVVCTSNAIVTETALSYLGVGVRPPAISLGRLLSAAVDQYAAYPWVFWAPTLVLVWITLALAFLGDGLRDVFDPRASGSRP